jgi:hypothetical protein
LGTEVPKECPVQDDFVRQHNFCVRRNSGALPRLQLLAVKNGPVGRLQVFDPDSAIVE